MNRFLTLLLMSSLVFGQGWAQTTFNVDMTCAPEGFENVFVTGPWCGWCANDTYNTMTDPDGDGVYSVEVPDLTGLVEYKYAINGFADQENLVNDMVDGATCAPITDYSAYANRQMDAGSVANDYYGTCDGTCNDTPPPPGGTVLFRVDMSEYAGTYGTVNLNGEFNGWCGACATMTDDDGDMIYEYAVDLPGGVVEYKFTLDGWTSQEELNDGDPCTSTIDGYINRTLDVSGDMVLPAVCWNSCAVCASTAQCDIDFDFGEAEFGTSPEAGESFMPGEEGSPYYDIWHLLVPMTAAGLDSTYPPTLPIDSLIVLDNGVDGNGVLSGVVFTDVATNEAFHPEEIGLEVLVNNNGDSPSENTFLGGNQYCTAFQGVPSRAGQYDVTIDLEAWATIFTPFNAPYTYHYQMLVVDPNPAGCTDPQACNYNPDSAEDDGSCVYGDCPATLWDVIVDSPDHTLLEVALLSTGVFEIVDLAPALTVVAPTDAAFVALVEALEITFEDLLSLEPLGDILAYHMFTEEVFSSDLSDGQLIETYQGSEVGISINQDGVFVNDAQITVADIAADNGVLHVIDQVLLPPPPAPTTVVDIIASSNDFGILEEALLISDLVDPLMGEGPFTVFAPTDAAFEELSGATGITVNELLGLEGLTDLLLSHVVGANALSTDLSDGQSITTLLGDDILVTISATGVFINDAQVVVADLVADNGVVHVIDAVLVNDESVFEIVGCMDPMACNFVPFASTDDGSCTFFCGCTDPEACNYDPQAEADDGSCCNCESGIHPLPYLNQTWKFSIESGAISIGPEPGSTEWYASPEGGLVDFQYDDRWTFTPGGTMHYNNNGSTMNPFDGYVETLMSVAPTTYSYDPAGFLSLPSITIDPLIVDGAIEICGWVGIWDSGPEYAIVELTETTLVLSALQQGGDCVNPVGSGYFTLKFEASEPDSFVDENGLCLAGCLDLAACNYVPYAEYDDGSCDYSCQGCTNEVALNFDAEATIDDGSCVLVSCEDVGNALWDMEVDMGLHLPPTDVLMHGAEAQTEWIIHLPSVVSEPSSGQLFAAQSWSDLEVSSLPPGIMVSMQTNEVLGGQQLCVEVTGVPEMPGTYMVQTTGLLTVSVFGSPFEIGTYVTETEVEILANPNPIPGCAYEGAVNFVSYADLDDGTCLYAGCTDPEALNFYPFITLDDGSCLFGDAVGPTCPSDIDQDGAVTTSDLLTLLSTFGIECE